MIDLLEISNLEITDDSELHEILLTRKYRPLVLIKEIKEEAPVERLFCLQNIKADGVATFQCTDCDTRIKIQVYTKIQSIVYCKLCKVDNKILKVKCYERKKEKKIDKKTMLDDDISKILNKTNYKLIQNSSTAPHTCSGATDLHELRLFTAIKKFLSEKVTV